MKRLTLALLALLAVPAAPAFAQQEGGRCDAASPGSATDEDLAVLLAEAACVSQELAGAAQGQAARLAKALELARAQPVPPPGPTSSAPPAGQWERAPTAAGKPAIPSDFETRQGLQPSWGSGVIPGSADPDPVGAFRMTCGDGDLAYVDPIQYPGSDRLSHLHLFYGLVGVRPGETYESARAAGRETTCGEGVVGLNRSAYWMPALLDGRGHAFRPNYVSIYYKRLPKTDARCRWDERNAPASANACRNMPQGLKLIAGRDMQNPGTQAQITRGAWFYCVKDGAQSPSRDDLSVLGDPACQGDTKLYQVFDFPNCWDGEHLDSPNHRDHVVYSAGSTIWGCPRSHPYLIPALHVAAEFQLRAADDRGLIRLSSDMFPGLAPGKTQHGDIFIAWDPEALQMLHDNCIDKRLNCAGGDLGNGWQLKSPTVRWDNPNRLVPAPKRPGGEHVGHAPA